jgi:hypothetical protein
MYSTGVQEEALKDFFVTLLPAPQNMLLEVFLAKKESSNYSYGYWLD